MMMPRVTPPLVPVYDVTSLSSSRHGVHLAPFARLSLARASLSPSAAMGSHEARVEASKRLGKEANYEASLMTHSHSRGRKDAAWASAVKGGEEEATALKREGSGEGLRARLREELDAQQLPVDGRSRRAQQLHLVAMLLRLLE